MIGRTIRMSVAPALAMLLTLASCGSDSKTASTDSVVASPTSSAAQTSATDTATTQPASSATEPASSAPAGTSAPDDSAACAEASGKVVGYSEPLPDPTFKIIEGIIADDLSKVGATLKPVNANLDPGKQIADVQSLVQSKIDLLMINPVDPNAVLPVFDEVRAAGIPIVVQETKVGGPYLTNITSDVEGAAADGAKLLADTVNGGQVTALLGPTFAEILAREDNAFTAAATANKLNLVDSQTNQKFTPDEAKVLTDAWKQKYGADLAGIWTFSDTSAIGIASSIDADFHPAVVSINGQPEVIPLIQDGKILATFDLQQDKIAHALAYAAIRGLCGQSVPTEINIALTKIDKSNVGSWKSPVDLAKEPFTVTLEDRNGKTFLVTK